MFRNTLNSQRIITKVVALVAITVLMTTGAVAETYRKGQQIEPAFEGWRPNPDGTFSFMFGYLNVNWEEEPNVPIGPENAFAPGDADRGQPTHFLPRRNRFTFEVTVPSDWGDRKLVWKDTRADANSPWGVLWLPPAKPADDMYDVQVTFDEPGTYVLWGRADDGGLYDDGYITVNVTE